MLGLALLVCGVVACRREGEDASRNPTQPTESEASTPPAAPAEDATATPQLKDVFEATPRYVFGVSYAPVVNRYPGLARHVAAYAAQARRDLEQAASTAGDSPATAPYELSLTFAEVMDTPDLVVVAADGSRYTGGAHGEPLIERFVWLPRQDRLLTSQELIPDARGWEVVSAHVREQLRTAVSVRADADELPPAERQHLVESAAKLIDAGTEPAAANFSRFQPLTNPAGKIVALRFVFPPYQVGPYSDGTQTSDVPASVILPYVAPAHRDLFAH